LCTPRPQFAPSNVWFCSPEYTRTPELAKREQPIRFLVRDRLCKFTRIFDEVFRTEGIRVIPTPVRAPRATAHAERWLGSVRRECLDRHLILVRRHLEQVVHGYIGHHNEHRP
jgi:putative transposase